MARNTALSFCSSPSCAPKPQPLLHNSARGPAKSQVLAALERAAGGAGAAVRGAAAGVAVGVAAGTGMGSAAGTGTTAAAGELGDAAEVSVLHAESAASA